MLPVLGQRDDDDSVQYRFTESRAFYLRLIPTSPLPEPLSVAKLQDVVSRRCIAVPTRTAFASTPARNRFGAIAYEPHGSSTEPVGFTQLFRNGEIWSVTKELVARHYDPPADHPHGQLEEHLRQNNPKFFRGRPKGTWAFAALPNRNGRNRFRRATHELARQPQRISQSTCLSPYLSQNIRFRVVVDSPKCGRAR